MSKPWFKTWTKKILEGDTAELSNEYLGMWVRLLAVAADYDVDGRYQQERGTIPLTTKQLARKLGQPYDTVRTYLEYFKTKKDEGDEDEKPMLTQGKEGIHITNWEHYQPSRQDIYRYKMKDTDGESGGDSDEKGNVATVWEETTGRMITQYEANSLNSCEDEFGLERVTAAIKEAASYGRGKVNIKYVQKILDNKREGNDKSKPSERLRDW